MSNRLLSRAALWVWAAFIAIPVFWPFASTIEGRLLPVVSEVALSQVTEVGAGVSFYVEFDKDRSCEFRELYWYDGPVRLVLDFEPDAELAPATRPVGEQFVGPWLLHGVTALEGTRAEVVHDCHPLWRTISTFYP